MNQINPQEERRGSHVNFNRTKQASTSSVHNPAKDNKTYHQKKKEDNDPIHSRRKKRITNQFQLQKRMTISKTNLQQSQAQLKKKEEDDPTQSSDEN
jgi:hypothetical protein